MCSILSVPYPVIHIREILDLSVSSHVLSVGILYPIFLSLSSLTWRPLFGFPLLRLFKIIVLAGLKDVN